MQGAQYLCGFSTTVVRTWRSTGVPVGCQAVGDREDLQVHAAASQRPAGGPGARHSRF